MHIETFTGRRVCTMADTPEDQREAAARARAIASVPKLLAALEGLIELPLVRDLAAKNGAVFTRYNDAKAALIEAGYTFD